MASAIRWGLSPRVRGSRREADRDIVERGSIPAGAGEPDAETIAGLTKSVYPRGCGGAA